MNKILINFSVCGQTLGISSAPNVVTDCKNLYDAGFSFDAAWSGVCPIVAQFHTDSTTYDVDCTSGRCRIPNECFAKSVFEVSLFGGDLITTNKVKIYLDQSGLKPGQFPEEPTPGYFQAVAIEVKGYRDEAKASEENAAEAKQTTIGKAQEAVTAATSALESAQFAAGSESNAESYMDQALTAMQTAVQAMSDLLAMIGKDIATLTDGKLTPSQIPPLSINDVFEVDRESDLVSLTAQRGDVALIIPGDVVTDSYMLSADDPTQLVNWKKLGVSYVANAGHAVTADNAANADKINNKRMVAMVQSQFDAAVKDPDTYYIVVPDEV